MIDKCYCEPGTDCPMCHMAGDDLSASVEVKKPNDACDCPHHRYVAGVEGRGPCVCGHCDWVRRGRPGAPAVDPDVIADARQDMRAASVEPEQPTCESCDDTGLCSEHHIEAHMTTNNTYRLKVSDQEYAALLSCHQKDRRAEFAKGERAERTRILGVIDREVVGRPLLRASLIAAIMRKET